MSEVFASLIDQRAHFGKGLYASRFEPNSYISKLRVLLNNYGGHETDPWSDEPQPPGVVEHVQQVWSDRADFCLPVLVPSGMLFNIHEQLTPDLATLGFGVSHDYKGRRQHANRDVWVIRVVDNQGHVQHATVASDVRIAIHQKHLESIPIDYNCLAQYASLLQARGKLREAGEEFLRALELCNNVCGENHMDYLRLMSKLGENFALQDQLNDVNFRINFFDRSPLRGESDSEEDSDNLSEAKRLIRKALEGQQSLLGAQHFDTLDTMYLLSSLLLRRDDIWDAEELCKASLSGRTELLGPKHPDTLASMRLLSGILEFQHKCFRDDSFLKEAEHVGREALKLSLETVGIHHPDTIQSRLLLARVLSRRKKFQEADELKKQAIDDGKYFLGPSHPFIRKCNLEDMNMDRAIFEQRMITGMAKAVNEMING